MFMIWTKIFIQAGYIYIPLGGGPLAATSTTFAKLGAPGLGGGPPFTASAIFARLTCPGGNPGGNRAAFVEGGPGLGGGP
jgi:hypothetical protein